MSQRVVALKLLHGERLGLPEQKRFAREAQLLSELAHPGIVSYIDHGVSDEGVPFLAMEWLEGEDLASYLHRGLLSVRASFRLIRRVAEALACAHVRGIIHRDLKPSNLFLV